MAAPAIPARAPQQNIRRSRLWLLALLGVGAAVRLYLAWHTFLNPDEALHYFVAAQSTFAAAYKASLTMAHPPLMIFLLHAWSRIGTSEIFLRLPFVLSGILFCWVMFLWVRQIAGENPACFTLALCVFLPSLIALSAEVRQYSLLLLFCSASLYWLELGILKNSAAWVAASTGALYLALVSHYSALIFAAAAGVYGLLRIRNTRKTVKFAWFAGQMGALGIIAFLFNSQILPLRRSGVPSEIAGTWLSSSIFQRGHEHFFSFALGKTVRLFRYFFSHGTIGTMGLLLFLFGAFILFRRGKNGLAVLLVVPFAITLAAAIGGVYPYGGTRHDVLLVLFGIPAIVVGLDALRLELVGIRWRGAKIVLLAVALIICNAFPSPSGPTIRPRNQNRRLMFQAMNFLRSQTAHSPIITDYQGGLILSYYLCGKNSPLPFGQTSNQLFKWQCGDFVVLTSMRTQQGFSLPELPQVIDQAWQSADMQSLWVFQTGWIEDRQQEWLLALHESGCSEMLNFGPNIRICELVRSRE